METMSQQIHNIKLLKENRRALRNNLTNAEAALWKIISNSQIEGRKFRRQHSVDLYILDFYCPSERLAIELDGAHHYTDEGVEYDRKRTEHLNTLNIKVIRFENKDIFERTEAVIEEIKRNFKTETK